MEGIMLPKRNNSTKGYFKETGVRQEQVYNNQKVIVDECSFTKLKEFNPTSRDHIGWAFMTWRGWKPDTFTDTGRPKIDEGVLMGIATTRS
jgi:DNA polymerase I